MGQHTQPMPPSNPNIGRGNNQMVDAQPVNLNNYSSLPKGVGVTQIKNRKEGLEEFLTRNDATKSINFEKLKESYLKDNNAPLSQKKLIDLPNLNKYLTNLRNKQSKLPLKMRIQEYMEK